MEDLWPDKIGTELPKPPVQIVKEQAALLGERTRNVVCAEVLPVETETPYEFSYGFFIVGPALGNYRYRLFSILHDIDLYPVRFDVDRDILR
ncbi:MAG: hypothetical protein NTW86_24745, partial [Candidatus Sumerlaeota bacterium]|nr:hypothetical protein [Candidatus Sumerlaeota bacterium]